jgi:amino acid transporter
LLRVVLLLGVLYVFKTYPQILHFGEIDGDTAVLPQLAEAVGVPWVNQVVSATVSVAFIVFVTAVTTAAARSLFTFAHEGALPRVFAKVHPSHKTPWTGVVFVGILALIFSAVATFSSAGRLVFDVYGGYVSNWDFLTSYLLVVIATPIWLRKINALTPLRLGVSVAATIGIGYVIVSNFYPVPEFPFNILPFVFGAILLAGLAWYCYLKRTRPEVAQRVGTIQTLSEAEQQRLTDEGILGVLQKYSPAP